MEKIVEKLADAAAKVIAKQIHAGGKPAPELQELKDALVLYYATRKQ